MLLHGIRSFLLVYLTLEFTHAHTYSARLMNTEYIKCHSIFGGENYARLAMDGEHRSARVYSLDKIKSCELSIVCVAMHANRSPFVDGKIIIFMRLREDYPIHELKLKRIQCVHSCFSHSHQCISGGQPSAARPMHVARTLVS